MHNSSKDVSKEMRKYNVTLILDEVNFYEASEIEASGKLSAMVKALANLVKQGIDPNLLESAELVMRVKEIALKKDREEAGWSFK